MKRLKFQIKITLVMGVISLLVGGFTHLALTDIYHGEADVTLEWHIVQICALLLLAFIGMALFTLVRVLTALSEVSVGTKVHQVGNESLVG